MSKKKATVFFVLCCIGGIAFYALKSDNAPGQAIEQRIGSTDPEVQSVVETPVVNEVVVADVLEQQSLDGDGDDGLDDALLDEEPPRVVFVTVRGDGAAVGAAVASETLDAKLMGQARTSPILASREVRIKGDAGGGAASATDLTGDSSVAAAGAGLSAVDGQLNDARRRLAALEQVEASLELPPAGDVGSGGAGADGGAGVASLAGQGGLGGAPPAQVNANAGVANVAGAQKRKLTRFSPPEAIVVMTEGTIINAVLETAINSQLPGNVRARVTRDVFDSITQQTTVVPKGAILLGAYQSRVSGGQERAFMSFRRMILPSGQSVDLLTPPATDRLGAAGVPADVDNRFWEIFGLSLLVGAVGFTVENEQTTTGLGQEKTTRGEAWGVLGDTVDEVRSQRRGWQPILTVPAGERINVFLTQDVGPMII